MSAHRGPHWTRWRRVVQVSIALFYAAVPVLHLYDIRAITGTLASLRVGGFDLTEPASAISGALASNTFTRTMLVGIAPVMLLALVAGPVFCSWVCPWGLISEGVDQVRSSLARKKRPGETWRSSRGLRWILLAALLAISAVTSLPLIALISAPRAITSLPLEMIYLNLISPVTAIVMFAALGVEIFAPRRVWCRLLCPVGTTFALLRTPKTLTVRWEESRCGCPSVALCHVRCRWGVDPRARDIFDACTNCMACVEVCPHDALSVGSGKFSSWGHDEKSLSFVQTRGRRR